MRNVTSITGRSGDGEFMHSDVLVAHGSAVSDRKRVDNDMSSEKQLRAARKTAEP